MGREIEKITSFSRTQIAPVFIKDITQKEPTYVLVNGINSAPFVVEAPYFFGKLTGSEIIIQPQGKYITTFQGLVQISPLVHAKFDVSLKAGAETIVDLKDFFGTIKIGTPKGETGELTITNKNDVPVRLYLIIWELST